MNRLIIEKIFSAGLILVLVSFAGGAFALSGGLGGLESGGESSSASTTNCGSAGDSTSGSSSSLSGGLTNLSGGGAQDCANEDTDADTMLNSWELTYSLDKNDASDAYGDADGDGSTNARESALGSAADTVDSDGDGVNDAEDPDPDNASVSSFSVDATYTGGGLNQNQQ